MDKPGPTSRIVRFGNFEIDREACVLRLKGQRIPLQIQPFRVLEALIDRAGTVVTRADLRATIWPATIFVDFDHGLNSAMTRLRQALGDSRDDPVFIETLPRIGYRFIHAIEQIDIEPAAATVAVPRQFSVRKIGSALATSLLIGMIAVTVWQLNGNSDTAGLLVAPVSLPTDSREAQLAFLRGLDFFEQRNKEAVELSIEQFTRATQADPDFAIAHAALAKAYASAGGNNSMAKFLSAEVALGPGLAAAERALQLDPGLAEAHEAFASVLNGLQQWSPGTDLAIEQAYRRSLELDPSVANLHLSFGNFLSTRGRSAEAITQYNEALDLDPLSPNINSRLGMELVSLGQTDAGLEFLLRTAELDPWQFNAQLRLGWAYIASGNLDAAELAFEAAEHISPGSARSLAFLAFVAGRKGDGERARALLASLLPLAEASDDPFDIAIAYVGLRDPENSIVWLAKTAEQTRTLHMQAPWGIHAPIYDWLRDDSRFAEIENRIRAANQLAAVRPSAGAY